MCVPRCRVTTRCAVWRTTPSTGWRWNGTAWRHQDWSSRLPAAPFQSTGRFADVDIRRRSRASPPPRRCRSSRQLPSHSLHPPLVNTLQAGIFTLLIFQHSVSHLSLSLSLSLSHTHTHTHTHTHRINHFLISRQTRVSRLSLDFLSPFIPMLRILSRQAVSCLMQSCHVLHMTVYTTARTVIWIYMPYAAEAWDDGQCPLSVCLSAHLDSTANQARITTIPSSWASWPCRLSLCFWGQKVTRS